METKKKSFIFQEKELSMLEKRKKLLLKSFLYFRKRNFLAPSLKNFYISEKNLHGLKIKNLLFKYKCK